MEQDATKNKRHESKLLHSFLPFRASKSPRKRRKVHHACVYCRRSHMTCDLERPCVRCKKRNIGHLCHDEPREATLTSKKKTYQHISPTNNYNELCRGKIHRYIGGSMGSSFDPLQDHAPDDLIPGSAALPQESLQIIPQPPIAGFSSNTTSDGSNQYIGNINDWPKSQGDQFHEIYNYHPSYMFKSPEVTTECNLLNDFLNSSLHDDGRLFPRDTTNIYANQTGGILSSGASSQAGSISSQAPRLLSAGNLSGNHISVSSNVTPIEKAREYYLQAADPTGNDAPEDRMERLLRAKYDAGMLKPFNYVKGYARLAVYMEGHLQSSQKLKILRQLERFRPKFREKVHSLTDMELIYVEMWFERSLMECDRVFASMAIPACCWRRTGEIFRGNKEMAELVQVRTENLRDGKIALHDIFAEESLVNYWEKFGAIAFNQNQKALLTSCILKSPNEKLKGSFIKCSFSFNIKRDDHKIPSLIIGNFLPQDPVKR